MVNKFIKFILILFTITLLSSSKSYAAAAFTTDGDPFIKGAVGDVVPPAQIDKSPNAVNNYILTAVNAVLVVGLILVLAYLLLGGIKWITAGGDPKAVQAAQGTITNAIIGLILLAVSFAVATLFNTFVGIGSARPGTAPAGQACSAGSFCASGMCGTALGPSYNPIPNVCCNPGLSTWTCI